MASLKLRVDDCVELRQVSENDTVELTDLIDQNRSHLKEWLPWLDNSTGLHDTARFIGRALEQAADENGFTFGIAFFPTCSQFADAPLLNETESPANRTLVRCIGTVSRSDL